MAKLNDTQTFLLSAASQTDSGSLLPLTGTTASGGARVAKAIAGLMTAGLVEKRETTKPANITRTDGDVSFGVFITPAGLAAIGVTDDVGDDMVTLPGEVTEPVEGSGPAPARPTKIAAVLALLARNEGATLAEMTGATGWLPHTTRAALTGLRKKGHALTRSVVDGTSRYHIGPAG